MKYLMRDTFFINDHHVCFYYYLLLVFVEWELLGEITFFPFFSQNFPHASGPWLCACLCFEGLQPDAVSFIQAVQIETLILQSMVKLNVRNVCNTEGQLHWGKALKTT